MLISFSLGDSVKFFKDGIDVVIVEKSGYNVVEVTISRELNLDFDTGASLLVSDRKSNLFINSALKIAKLKSKGKEVGGFSFLMDEGTLLKSNVTFYLHENEREVAVSISFSKKNNSVSSLIIFKGFEREK